MLERLRNSPWSPLASLALPTGLLLVLHATGCTDAIAGPPGAAELSLPAGPFASVNGANRIDNLTVEESSDGTTTLRLAGTRKPTFNVYRLENPDRLVVDISSSERGKAVPHVSVDSWAVGRVALDASQENGADVVRVVVDLKRPSSYIVVPKGNELLVTVTPREAPPETYFNRKGAGARKAEIEALERDAKLRAEKADALAQEAESRARAAETRAEAAAKALAAAHEDGKFLSRRKKAALEEQRGELLRMQTEAARARQLADRSQREALAAREAAEREASEILAEARGYAQHKRARADELEKAAEEARKAAQAERRAAGAEAAAAKAEAAAEKARAEGEARQTRKAAEAEAKRLRAEAGRLRSQAERQRAEADAEAAKIRQLAKVEADQLRGAAQKEASALRGAAEKEATALRREADAQRVRAQQMLVEASAAMAKAREERDQAKKARGEAEKALSEARSASSKARSSERAELDRAVSQAEAAKKAADARHAAAQAKLAKLDSDRVRLEKVLAQQSKRSEDLTRSIEQKQSELEQLRASVEAARGELSKLAEAGTRTGQRSTRESEALARKQAELNQAESALHAVKNTIGEEARRLEELQEKVAAAQASLDDAIVDSGGRKRLKDDWQAQRDATPTARIKDVRFEDGADASKVIIEVDGPMIFSGSNITPTMKGIVFEGARIPEALERSLDASGYDGPVGRITSFREGDQVKVIVATTEQVQPQLEELPGKLVWTFPRSKSPTGDAGRNQVVSLAGSQVAGFATPPAPMANEGSSTYGRRPKWRGERIDIELQDAPIKDVLLLFSDIGRVNIIAGSGVDGIVTMRLAAVPWDQALDIILRSLGLGMVQEGNVIRVATLDALEDERRKAVEKANAQVQLKPLETRLVPLSYSTVSDMIPKVQSVLSSRGSVTPDSRTNTLIIMDVVDNIALAEQLINSLDSQTPQVLIEARIVEARTNWLRQLGIQWGFDFISSPGTGNPTGLFFPNSVGVAGGSGNPQPDVRGLILPAAQASPNYAVDLPAPVGGGSGGAIGFSFGSLSGNLNTNLRLSAAEEEGEVRIISAPKIVTLDNSQAQIEQGVQIPISQVSAQGVNTRYVNATLALRVTPHVTNEGSVLLDVQVQKNEADFINTGARGDPTILTKQAQSQMLITDGDTAVIGGIFTRNQAVNRSKVPWLADIPIIGWFFKNKSEADTRTEMLIFMTPKIINRSTSIGG